MERREVGERLHFVGQDVFGRFADRVVGRDLDHDAVEVLDDILNLLCRGVLAHDTEKYYEKRRTLDAIVIEWLDGSHGCG